MVPHPLGGTIAPAACKHRSAWDVVGTFDSAGQRARSGVCPTLGDKEEYNDPDVAVRLRSRKTPARQVRQRGLSDGRLKGGEGGRQAWALRRGGSTLVMLGEGGRALGTIRTPKPMRPGSTFRGREAGRGPGRSTKHVTCTPGI